MKSINKKDTIFVAGHTGMVGSALVKELLKKDIINYTCQLEKNSIY